MNFWALVSRITVLALLWLNGAHGNGGQQHDEQTVLHRRGQGIPEDEIQLRGVIRQAETDQLSSEILTNRTRAYLSCESGEMVVKINISEPFRGVAYADYDRQSPCKFYGDGRKYYEMRIPLKGCGTKQEGPRLFINNIILRFHPSLELEEDEIKTIICRYPPPLAPTPSTVPPFAAVPTPPLAAIVPAKLSEVELLLIICALLFLTLLLLGVGIAYYCLKRRNIKVIRRRKAISSAPPSEITKLSGSTMGFSMFDPIRIPRAMAQSTSGSEAALLTSMSSHHDGSGDRSDTIPSDYPSESPSSGNSDEEEGEGQRSVIVSESSTIRRDHYRYENQAFVPDTVSLHSGYTAEDHERSQSLSMLQVSASTLMKQHEPKLKQIVAKDEYLTTITEQEEMLQQEAIDNWYASLTSVKHPPPVKRISKKPPSIYGSIPDNDDRSHSEVLEEVPTKRPYAPSLYGSIPDNDNWSYSEYNVEPSVRPRTKEPRLQTASTTDYMVDTQSVTDIREDTVTYRKEIRPPDDAQIVPARKPRIVVQNIDDLYVTTTQEIDTTEQISRKHVIREEAEKPMEPSNWDVTIRHYPPRLPPDPDTASHYPESEFSNIYSYNDGRDSPSPTGRTGIAYSRRPSIPDHHPEQRKPWEVLIRVLEPPYLEEVEELAPETKEVLRTLVTTDTMFRTLIQEATTTEEVVRISRHEKYESVFAPDQWQVIIRVLTHPDYPYATAKDSDTKMDAIRVPKHSLRSDPDSHHKPVTLSSVQEHDLVTQLSRMERSHAQAGLTDFDLQSTTTDLDRMEKESIWSAETGFTFRTARSIAERSTSEFVEDVPTIRHSSYGDFSTVPEEAVASYSFATVSSAMRDQQSARNKHRTLERSSTEIIINSPIIRAIDRASTVGEREEIKSVTETEIVDWLR